VKRVRNVLALLLIGAAGCDSCRKAEPEPTAAETPSAPSAAPAASDAAVSMFTKVVPDAGRAQPWASVPSATAPLLPNMSIAERFEAEQKARPAGVKPNVESVFAALEGAGLKVVDKKQHLAQTSGARYCVGARVVAGAKELLVISVCEFVSAEVAAGSRDYSNEALKVIPNRTVHANKQTTMTLREADPVTPEIAAANAKALSVYDAL
jgi:hypothetical protein